MDGNISQAIYSHSSCAHPFLSFESSTLIMAETETQAISLDGQQFFTCLSCTIAFLTAEDQRVHYRSDHHRYNMKRRVASLPPVSVAVFNEKVLERRQETSVMLSPKGSTCEVCSKSYTTDNAYKSHMNSKKHKENELKALSRPKVEAASEPEEHVASTSMAAPETPAPTQPEGVSLAVDADADEDEVNMTLDQKIAAARSRLSPAHCLFCSTISPSLESNLTHMSSEHSFFIPDAEFLIDLTGLITYLGEKIAVGNVCIYCNGKGREFRTLHAVRKHMVDKSHCKIAYESQKDMLEIVGYYDFSASYPDAEEHEKRKAERKAAKKAAEEAAEGWEDAEEDNSEVDEVVDEDASTPEESDEDEKSEDSDSDDSIFDNQITYGDSPLELVLPSGSRIGHRSMRRYYAQSFPGGHGGKPEDPNSGAALVRRLLADKNSALVPSRGGFGAYGAGTTVVKARNRGEAREAGRHVREFRDQTRREQFKTKVGFRHNSQKHFRDPLLQ
ncbi:C2H2 type zinc-finger-domain-containing protein [Amylostereum chailletii]|nr:C2H2 type zinc-finger-domain-containing protein [Amylostereum chailletii]